PPKASSRAARGAAGALARDRVDRARGGTDRGQTGPGSAARGEGTARVRARAGRGQELPERTGVAARDPVEDEGGPVLDVGEGEAPGGHGGRGRYVRGELRDLRQRRATGAASEAGQARAVRARRGGPGALGGCAPANVDHGDRP